MIEATNDDKSKILSFLKEDISKCLYIYADLSTMAIDGSRITVWFSEEEGKLKNVVMKYYSSFQLYGRFSEEDYSWIAVAANNYNVGRIHGDKKAINELIRYVDCSYRDFYGEIFRFEKCKVADYEGIVKEATPEDAKEIAELVMLDEMLSHGYSVGELEEQFYDRIRHRTGRSFVIRDNDAIVGHICYMVETDIFCISGFIIVDPSCRNLLYPYLLQYAAYNIAKNEGRDHYFFVDQDRRSKMFQAMGNPISSYYGKLIKKG